MRVLLAVLLAALLRGLLACGSVRSSGSDAGGHADAQQGLPDASARAPDAFHPRDAAVDSRARVADALPEAAVDGGLPDASSTEAGADASPDGGGTCSNGTAPIAYSRLSCPGTPGAVPTSLGTAFSTSMPGDVLSLGGLDDSSLPCFPVRVCVPLGAPTLLFSDDPESPSSDGILYADELTAGTYRAYVYHVNADTQLRKFPVVLLNQGATTVHATVLAKGIAGPSQDYIDVGKQALLRWFTSGSTVPVETVDVPAGMRVLLDSDLDATTASTNDLVHAIFDFSVDGPVKLSIVSVLSTEDATVVTSGLGLLPDDGMHVRGSFPGADLTIEATAPIDLTGARHIRLGGGVTDEPLAGYDYVDGTHVSLDGNYGVEYTISVGELTSNSGSVGVLLSPQGGAWAGLLAMLTGATLVPAGEDAVSTQTDGIDVALAAGAMTEPSFTVMSAGGSSLPVDVVTVPLP